MFFSEATIAQILPYKNSMLPLGTRVKDLLSRLTLEEKVSLMGYRSKAVLRLNIPAYNWWNEGLHGVARAGEATVFPQAIGMAATFNPDLLQQVADVISTEARAKYNLSTAQNKHLMYMGLSFWSPKDQRKTRRRANCRDQNPGFRTVKVGYAKAPLSTLQRRI